MRLTFAIMGSSLYNGSRQILGRSSYETQGVFLRFRMPPGDPGRFAVHASGVLWHCGSNYDRSAWQRQRGRRGAGREILRDRLRRCCRYRLCCGNYDLSIPGAKKRSGSQKKFLRQFTVCLRHCRAVYRTVRPVSGIDHGPLYKGSANETGRCRLSGNRGRQLSAHGRCHASLHPFPLHGESPSASLCQHGISRVEYRLELHADLRQMRFFCHGHKRRRYCYGTLAVCQLPADAADAAETGGLVCSAGRGQKGSGPVQLEAVRRHAAPHSRV